jgi:hypothetical protein
MTAPQLQDLLKIKQSLGIPDPRYGLKECELCDNDVWRPGVTCAVPPKDEAAAKDPEAEAAVKAITEQILRKLNGCFGGAVKRCGMVCLDAHPHPGPLPEERGNYCQSVGKS